jgi:hypothetical protein
VSPEETRLLAVMLMASNCWLCRGLCQPRSVPLVPATTVRTYLHALGRQRRLTVLATLLTVAVFMLLLGLPTQVDPDLRDLRLAAASCGQRNAPYDTPTCHALLPGGQWAIEEVQPDGTRRVVGMVARPTVPEDCLLLMKDIFALEEPRMVSYRCA